MKLPRSVSGHLQNQIETSGMVTTAFAHALQLLDQVIPHHDLDRLAGGEDVQTEARMGSSRLPLNHWDGQGLRLLRVNPSQPQADRLPHRGASSGHASDAHWQPQPTQLRSDGLFLFSFFFFFFFWFTWLQRLSWMWP